MEFCEDLCKNAKSVREELQLYRFDIKDHNFQQIIENFQHLEKITFRSCHFHFSTKLRFRNLDGWKAEKISFIHCAFKGAKGAPKTNFGANLDLLSNFFDPLLEIQVVEDTLQTILAEGCRIKEDELQRLLAGKQVKGTTDNL